jgi:TRAP-type C4-dicarboxylate transport system permease small subunit
MDMLVAYWVTDPISFVIIGVFIAAILAIALSNPRSPMQIFNNIDSAVDRLASLLNILAAAWILVMAWIVLVDVLALGLVSIEHSLERSRGTILSWDFKPMEGATEIIANSVIVILFAQIPLAIRHGGMIRTTIVYDNAGRKLRNSIDGVAYVLGIMFFAAIAIGGWENMVLGYFRQEFQIAGRGTLPLWPFRYVTVWFSVLACLIYILLFIKLFLGQETEAKRAPLETTIVID